MAKLQATTFSRIHTKTNKKTSQGGRNSQIKLSSMNKNAKRSFKKNRGQGKAS